MAAYTKFQQIKREESERVRGGERNQIKFIDIRFERWQVVRFRKARKKQGFSNLHVIFNTVFIHSYQIFN